MQPTHVLIVEDEIKIQQLLKDYLKAEGFRVSCLDRGDTVVPFVKQQEPDIILMDVMLPAVDGVEICRQIRHFSNIPIIMITARVEEIDRIIGLEVGADDYVCKPFSPREIVARVKAMMRRMNRSMESKTIKAGPIELNEDTHQVMVNEQELRLTPIEFGLLKVMLSRPGRVFPRKELIAYVQGYEFDGYDRTVDTHIKNLRRKLATSTPDQEIIHSVYGVGYTLQID